jgi:hypothetical protein
VVKNLLSGWEVLMASSTQKPGFIHKLFGLRKEVKQYFDKDNLGTRYKSEEETASYWIARMQVTKKDPFVLYNFDSLDSAINAIREVPCIHMAEDSGRLICTETLDFGVYPMKEGGYDAFLCGPNLTHDMWKIAKASFIKHGGRPRGQGDLEPEKTIKKADLKEPEKTIKKADLKEPEKVKFIRKENQQKIVGGVPFIMTYEIYRGPDAATAQSFLSTKKVTQPRYYIIVETPQGNYGRDIDGIYRE